MPSSPSEAQSATSRHNGAKSHGPKDTRFSRLNARTHGLRAALKPPDDPEEAALYLDLLGDLLAAYKPNNCTEELLLQEIAILELRGVKIARALLDAPISLNLDKLKPTMLLLRYETATQRKLQQKTAQLEELKRAARREAEAAEQSRQAQAPKPEAKATAPSEAGSGSFGKTPEAMPAPEKPVALSGEEKIRQAIEELRRRNGEPAMPVRSGSFGNLLTDAGIRETLEGARALCAGGNGKQEG